jgi:hypothetical protein
MDETHMALVGRLAIPHHAGAAYRTLLSCGLAALPAVREGLRHENADVRHRCCQFLDRFMTPEVMDDLVAMLDDPDNRVRCSVLHSLACDRCKESDCRLDATRVLPRAIAVLRSDPDAHVRAMAIEVVGRWVHDSLAAQAALSTAAQANSSLTARKKARWYLPGGTIHRRAMANQRCRTG